MFTLGIAYTRERIYGEVGGSMQSYLPHADGSVRAACLRRDMNPDAPDVILVGTGDGIEHAADLLINQSSPVPTFIRQGSGEWEYVGDFRVKRSTQNAEDIAEQTRLTGRSDITRIIHMIPVGDATTNG